MAEIPVDKLEMLDNLHGRVVGSFEINRVPEGDAPTDIKEAWLGATLPVRQRGVGITAAEYYDLLSGEMKQNPYPVSVATIEAVDRLKKLGRNEAAAYWTLFELGGLSVLTFRAWEGVLTITDPAVLS